MESIKSKITGWERTYRLTEKCPELAIIRHDPGGVYDYTEMGMEDAIYTVLYDSLSGHPIEKAAVEWVLQNQDLDHAPYWSEDEYDLIEQYGSLEAATSVAIEAFKEDARMCILTFSKEEILDEAAADSPWPIVFGFVEVIEDE